MTDDTRRPFSRRDAAEDRHRRRRRAVSRPRRGRAGAAAGAAGPARRHHARRRLRAPGQGAPRARGLRRAGNGPAPRPPRDRRGRGEGGLRRRAGEGGEGAGGRGQGRPEAAGRLREGRPRLREPLPARGPRPRVRGDAVELARADGGRGHGERRPRRGRGPVRGHARGVLAARGRLRAHAAALRDPRELLLRLERAPRPEPRPGGDARRAHPRRVRLHPRPALPALREPGRGALAAIRAPQAERQPVPDPRPRAGGAVPGRPPWRPFRPPRLDELAVARPAGLPRPRAPRRTTRGGRRPTPAGT